MLRTLTRTFLAGPVFAGCLILGNAGVVLAQDATAPSNGPASPPAATSSTTATDTSVPGAPAALPPGSSNATPGGESTIGPVASQNIPPAYLTGTQGMTPQEIEAIIADPAIVMKTDVPTLISRQVRLFVGSDNRGVQAMIDLAKRPEVGIVRLGPIAVGLAQATRGAPPTDAAYGAYIQEAVARSGSEELISAYSAVLQTVEVETASLGSTGGPGGSPGSGSLGGAGAPGISNGFNGDDTVAQTSESFGSAARGSVAYTGDGSDGDAEGFGSIPFAQSLVPNGDVDGVDLVDPEFNGLVPNNTTCSDVSPVVPCT